MMAFLIGTLVNCHFLNKAISGPLKIRISMSESFAATKTRSVHVTKWQHNATHANWIGRISLFQFFSKLTTYVHGSMCDMNFIYFLQTNLLAQQNQQNWTWLWWTMFLWHVFIFTSNLLVEVMPLQIPLERCCHFLPNGQAYSDWLLLLWETE